MELSASARVLNDPTMIEGDIGFSATTEQCLVVASCTIQYSSGAIANAGATRTADIIPITKDFLIVVSPKASGRKLI
jgi:hypothetical protein